MPRGILEKVISGQKKRNNHAEVVDDLGRAIVSGQLPVGSLLPGDIELAERFKVSRTVLREAMKTLTAKGLIVPRARIGTKVTPKSQWNLFDPDILSWHFDTGIDEEFLVHLSEMRLAFEPFAAGLAARHATIEDVETLYGCADEMDFADHTAESLAKADLQFHLSIVEACGNPFMRTVGSLIEAALVGVFKLSSTLAVGARIGEVAINHRLIVDAIANHDEEAAQQAMRKVVLAGTEHVKARITEANRQD